MYLQTQTDIFASAISFAGTSSNTSYWGYGSSGYSLSSISSPGGYPWNDKEFYVEQSPLFNADKINTPLLLMHGERDVNVPFGESLQLFTALKILNRPVELLQVKEGGHAFAKYDGRLQFYHWFSRELFPLMSLSFFNLIPSCSICNSTIKRSAILSFSEHIHPYLNSDYTPAFSLSYKPETNNKWSIIIEGDNDPKEFNMIEMFKLRDIYLE